MNPLLKVLFIFMCLGEVFIASMSFAASESNFSVEVQTIPQTLSLGQSIVLEMTLTYPSDYSPNLNLIRRRLLTDGSLQDPPFTLVSDQAFPQKSEGNHTIQIFQFALSPQMTGSHFLSARLIPFDPLEKTGKTVEIPSPILAIQVMPPDQPIALSSLIESPLPLSQHLPVTLSQGNKNQFLENPYLLGQEAQANLSYFQHKSFPWLGVLAALIVLGVLVLIRLLPINLNLAHLEACTKEQNDQEIKTALQSIAATSPKDGQEIKSWITQLDLLFRRYLWNTYEVPAFSMTKEELIQKTESLEELTPSVKQGMNQAFYQAERIKFGQYSPETAESEGLKETAEAIAQIPSFSHSKPVS